MPRVPLPDLAGSCERFLAWCAPLLTPAELDETRAAVEDFLAPDSAARALQAALERYDAEPGVHSWLDTFWPYRYLGRRDRIALNANFFFLFRDAGPGERADPQVAHAARLVAAAVDFKLRLDDERIPPACHRGAPLSMEQHKFLFSETRIPGKEQDTVRAPYSAERPGPSRARHIVVFVGGRMIRMDVVAPDGLPYPVHEIGAALRAAADAAAVSVRPAESVGHLTTMARAEWADRRQALLALDPANADALETVEAALFCLCLDALAPQDTLQTCDHLLHGDSGNRWFDKSLSLIVFPDGRAGINVEHCSLDGTTMLSFVDDILGRSTGDLSGPFAAGRPAFELVEFVLDDDLRAVVAAAADSFAAYAADTATTLVSFEDFGADRAKKLGMSPDAFVQMAYQLAHRRAKGHIGATYESIATRQYRHGRTEAMRVVTPEILAFVAAMDDPDADDAARRDAFRSAAQAHVARAKDCQQGRAPEQHLWELQLIQRRRGGELGVTEPLALYESPGWLTMRDDYLSTSSAPSTNIEYFGFGSTSSQCIGVAYVLLPDRLNLYLSTPRQVAHQMAAFAGELRRAIAELVDLLVAGLNPYRG